ncbi:MAG: DUF4349 domain-containing protein [Kineothrix sp.]
MNQRKYLMGMMGAALLCLGGCGSGSKSADMAAGMMTEEAAVMEAGSSAGEIYGQEYWEEPAAEAVERTEPGEGSSASVETSRKLIKNVNLNVETEEFDLLLSKMEKRTADLGGYIENMNVYNGSSWYGGGSRSADLTIRIPSDRLDGFVTEVAEVSNMIRREESAQDVTLEYVDLESHKKVLITEQGRLLELLEQAESIEDILVLEERLSQVRYELESMESQLRTYDNLIDYSTVYLSISEVEQLTPVKEVSALERMGSGFLNSMRNLKDFLADFLIGFVIGLPYILFLAALVIASVFLVRRIRKRKEAKIKGQMGQDREEGENHGKEL